MEEEYRHRERTTVGGWSDTTYDGNRSHGERLSVAETRIAHIGDKISMNAERIHTIANSLTATNARLTILEHDTRRHSETVIELAPMIADFKRKEARRGITKDLLNWGTVALMAYLAFAGREQWGSVLRALGRASAVN